MPHNGSETSSPRGEADDRHLWPELHRLTRERVPTVLFGEQIARDGGAD